MRGEYPFSVDHYAVDKELGMHRLALCQWLIENGFKPEAAKRIHWLAWRNGVTYAMLTLRNERGFPFEGDAGIAISQPFKVAGMPPGAGSAESRALRERYWLQQLGGEKYLLDRAAGVK